MNADGSLSPWKKPRRIPPPPGAVRGIQYANLGIAGALGQFDSLTSASQADDAKRDKAG